MTTRGTNNQLFLDQISFSDITETVTVPVIKDWEWTISGTGQGLLTGHNCLKFCHFDMLKGQIDFAGDGDVITAPGLSVDLVQEMGEKYVYQTQFTPEEQTAYLAQAQTRERIRCLQDQAIRTNLRGIIQLQYDNGSWLAEVDTQRVKDLTGIESNHVLSREDGVNLFHQMSSALHVRPLKEVNGFLTRRNNVYDFLHREYRNQYENMLQAIDNRMIDGTGYGIESVLNQLEKSVREDMKSVLPKEETVGNLRFVNATPERKTAIQAFVKSRISLTLTYEQKRSYEQATRTQVRNKFLQSATALRETLQDAWSPETSDANDTTL